ncbi:DUF4835 family protein [Paludibacter sp. 221]|uniref:type IX secretion system protein PorD n=1 Tax=Paludibacter sp. 221 TaxID=2302939 RepID=UPI0013D2EC84|nr:DUF4835 family protein [Paludibacter sp. 221]NDV47443.1 DUF4835 family protein [Paludibacter sp. 221]
MKYNIIIIIFLFVSGSLFTQELNCKVEVKSDQIEGSNKAVFTALQNSITEFMNTRRWTEMNFNAQERIVCNMTFIVKSYDEAANRMNMELTVQSSRPVYNSGYNSTLLNFRDTEIEIDYKEFDQLELVENTFVSNLTAVLAYYAYIIIGYDMDSYSRLGGTPFFQAAENIVLSAQSSEFKGWRAELANSKNRYALVNNLMDEAFKKYRNYFYEYHRLGLDEMSANVTNARARIAEGLPVLREANRARPSAVVINTFLDSKKDELINIFSEATTEEKQRAVEILSDVSPTRSAEWEKIMK